MKESFKTFQSGNLKSSQITEKKNTYEFIAKINNIHLRTLSLFNENFNSHISILKEKVSNIKNVLYFDPEHSIMVDNVSLLDRRLNKGEATIAFCSVESYDLSNPMHSCSIETITTLYNDFVYTEKVINQPFLTTRQLRRLSIMITTVNPFYSMGFHKLAIVQRSL
jgi:hypothetical protein